MIGTQQFSINDYNLTTISISCKYLVVTNELYQVIAMVKKYSIYSNSVVSKIYI